MKGIVRQVGETNELPVSIIEFCTREMSENNPGAFRSDSQMVVVVSERGTHVLLQVVQKFVSHDGDHLPLQLRRSGR